MALVPTRVKPGVSLVIVVLALAAWRVVPGAADDPRRIISLVPATTEMLFAMGAGGRLAGVSSYDRYPTQVNRLARLGGLLDPDDPNDPNDSVGADSNWFVNRFPSNAWSTSCTGFM